MAVAVATTYLAVLSTLFAVAQGFAIGPHSVPRCARSALTALPTPDGWSEEDAADVAGIIADVDTAALRAYDPTHRATAGNSADAPLFHMGRPQVPVVSPLLRFKSWLPAPHVTPTARTARLVEVLAGRTAIFAATCGVYLEATAGRSVPMQLASTTNEYATQLLAALPHAEDIVRACAAVTESV